MTTARARRRCKRLALLLSLSALSSCSERHTTENEQTQPSPNASILPAPLASAAELTGSGQSGASGADSAGRVISGDPELPPEPAPADRPLPEDTLGTREASGYTLEAAFRWPDLPPVPSGTEASSVMRGASERLELKVVVDLTTNGRMRFAFESSAFPLPVHSELRARNRYYGHVLVWPGSTAYRVLPAGSLRALFAERRADVAPLLRPVLRPGGGGALLGHRTIQTDIETSLGVLSLEQATLPAATAGELLCRLLVELVGAEPSNDACRPERVPLAAQYKWAGGGSIGFFVTSLTDRKDPSGITVPVPPPSARWAIGELPASSNALLDADELSRLKWRPLHPAPATGKVTEGVTCANETDLLQYVFLDGVPVAWLLPHSREHLSGPPPGKYQVAFRDFFGTQVTAPSPRDLPAFVHIGKPEDDGG